MNTAQAVGPVYALLADGSTVEIRPAGPADFDAVKAMHEAMSPDNAYFRFFSLSRTAAETEARRICREPGPGRVALLALAGGQVVGCASYETLRGQPDHRVEVAFAVADHMHHKGVATLLLEHLVFHARSHQVTAFTGQTLAEKWKDGATTLHGQHVHGFPNFMLSTTRQASWDNNFPFPQEIVATHLAKLIRRAMDAGADTVEVTAQAEAEWVRYHEMLGERGFKRWQECTPSYFNQEGTADARVLRNGAWRRAARWSITMRKPVRCGWSGSRAPIRPTGRSQPSSAPSTTSCSPPRTKRSRSCGPVVSSSTSTRRLSASSAASC